MAEKVLTATFISINGVDLSEHFTSNRRACGGRRAGGHGLRR